jgi:hypothetical protein
VRGRRELEAQSTRVELLEDARAVGDDGMNPEPELVDQAGREERTRERRDPVALRARS